MNKEILKAAKKYALAYDGYFQALSQAIVGELKKRGIGPLEPFMCVYCFCDPSLDIPIKQDIIRYNEENLIEFFDVAGSVAGWLYVFEIEMLCKYFEALSNDQIPMFNTREKDTPNGLLIKGWFVRDKEKYKVMQDATNYLATYAVINGKEISEEDMLKQGFDRVDTEGNIVSSLSKEPCSDNRKKLPVPAKSNYDEMLKRAYNRSEILREIRVYDKI